MQVELNARVLQMVRRVAQRQGRSLPEVLEEAVLRYLEDAEALADAREAERLFEDIGQGQRARGVEPLSEEEAMLLADEELHAMRRERRSAGREQQVKR